MIEIKTELGRKLRNADGSPVAEVERMLVAQLARYLGASIRERVSKRGDLAGQTAPTWDDEKRKDVSARYPDNVTAPGRGGAESYRSSADYHARNRTKRGTYNTTGGMWSGLSAVVSSLTRATIQFRGRSPGQDARFVQGVSRPLKVSNALKAWTVFEKHRVNVLQPSDEELQLAEKACVHSLAGAMSRVLAIEWQGEPPMVGNVEQIFARVFGAKPLKNSTEGA